jgi:hypothetical protein
VAIAEQSIACHSKPVPVAGRVQTLDSPFMEHRSSKGPEFDSVPRADRCIGRWDAWH